tara:strand:- start:482 stop:733 length:252 start_codon:yes stop_codon:yes gene_type:complete
MNDHDYHSKVGRFVHTDITKLNLKKQKQAEKEMSKHYKNKKKPTPHPYYDGDKKKATESFALRMIAYSLLLLIGLYIIIAGTS